MSNRRSRSIPSYRLHKQSGQAVVTLTDPFGRRRDVLLGRYDAPESRAEYLRVVAEWEASGRSLPARGTGPSADITVNEILVGYWQFAERHYRKFDGEPTSELHPIRCALRPLKELYGRSRAADFGPLALKAVRLRMVESGLCRGVVNKHTSRVKRAFKWAVAEELVPPSLLHGLQAVTGLQRGRSAARETESVVPVPDADVRAVLPHLRSPVRAMVELQLLTGMRPGEACAMRPCDIDSAGAVWFYRPPAHKTAHLGKSRVVALGPRAQAVLNPFVALAAAADAHLFSPRLAMALRRKARRAARKSPVQPSQMDRRKKAPERSPGERYSTLSYARSIGYACGRIGMPPWSPNRLRHNFATGVRKLYGLEGAQVVLGHSSADITQVYAERDMSMAAKIAAEIG